MPITPNNVIKFFFLSKNITLQNRKRLKDFLVFLLKREGYTGKSINYIFCSDKYLLGLNRQYLNHDFLTDIITFDLSGNSGPIEAEIYISVDRVRDNARALAVNIGDETLRVMFHGLLHLCGYGDKKQAERKLMREKEDLYIRMYKKK